MSASVKGKKVEGPTDAAKNQVHVNKDERKKSEEFLTRDVHSQNFVNIDNIRKQVNQREWELTKKWPQKYEVLTGEFLQKILSEEYQKSNKNQPKKMLKENDDDGSPYGKPETSPPIPVTSSAFVGWRSSNKIYDLEFAGMKYISPKHTIEPPIQDGEFRVEKQCFIFLG